MIVVFGFLRLILLFIILFGSIAILPTFLFIAAFVTGNTIGKVTNSFFCMFLPDFTF